MVQLKMQQRNFEAAINLRFLVRATIFAANWACRVAVASYQLPQSGAYVAANYSHILLAAAVKSKAVKAPALPKFA